MAGLTSSWNTTVSPMTIMDLPMGVNAAHEVMLMNGGSARPSTWSGMSSRGLLTLNTFSVLSYMPWRPVSLSMAAVSIAGGAAWTMAVKPMPANASAMQEVPIMKLFLG